MSKYSREMIAQIVAANDIVDVIGGALDLKPAGANRYKALSPFTNEKTPSFTVSRDRQMYYCFSSGQGGDVIKYLMETEGLSFNEALQKLADRAGIRLESSGREGDGEAYLRKRVLELNEFAARFYRRRLLDGAAGAYGREYLQRRELPPEIEARFGLGLAVDEWSQLTDAAQKQQFRESELIASGLVRRGERSVYDFFRNRLIVPIKDVSGNIVAFGGRDLGDSPAKYINSPETAAYKKSRVLYGLYEAREAMRREQRVILVEGYFDLMRCFAAGVENVVATCGTALTEQQAMLIKRYVPEVVVVYDGDAAGIRAAIKGISVLTDAGLTVYATALPDGKDPDDYVRAMGAEAFKEQIRSAPDFVSFYIEQNVDKTRTIEGRTEVAHELFAIIRNLEPPIRVEQYLQRIGDGLRIHHWECKRDFERFCKSRRGPVASNGNPQSVGNATPAFVKDDVDFIAALVAFPELGRFNKDEWTEIATEEPAFTVAKVVVDADHGFMLSDLETEIERQLYTAAVNTEVPGQIKAKQLVDERISGFKRDAWSREMEMLQKRMTEAGRDMDDKRCAELYDRILELKLRMEELGAA